jgi:hypothetical protein
MRIHKVIQRRIQRHEGGVQMDMSLNAVVSANVNERSARSGQAAANKDTPGGATMPEEEYKKLSREELNELAGEELPERAAMSLINANVAAPINAAVALNALSDNSTAIATATQNAPIDQSN